MASPNISFDAIPASLRKPGKYFEFNTRLAVRTLPGNPQRVLLIGQRLADSAQPALEPLAIFSDEQAAQSFGRGSYAHRMARAAIRANPYLDLTVVAVDDAAAGIAASATLTLTGPASSSGTLSLWVANTRVDVAVASGDSDVVVLAALLAAIAKVPDLPITAADDAGDEVAYVADAKASSAKSGAKAATSRVATPSSATLTARHKGAAGNGIALKVSSSAAGLVPSCTAMTGGANDPDLAPALAAVVGAGHDIVVSPFADDSALQALGEHLDFVSGPLEQRGAIGCFAWVDSLSTGTTLTAALNHGRITGAWHRSSACLVGEIAAGYAAVLASEEDPARPLNTLAIAGLDVTPQNAWPSRTEQESALHNGLTPLEVGPGNTVQIVRAISTYTRNAEGIDDVALLDITTIRTLDYVRKACRERISLRFPREKLSDKTPPKVRSELLDVLYKLEELEIVEAVDANKDGLIVERDSQDVNRLDARIPVDVVNGLHIFAGRIDLLL